jgi:hypothetical protein
MSPRKLAAALAVTAIAVLPTLLAGAGTAAAQTADDELAGYVGMAAGAAFSFQPIFPGLLPTGDAPFEVTGALATSNVKSGGNAYAMAAAAFPGSAAANSGPLIGTAAGQPLFTKVVPPFPGIVTASQDDGQKSVGTEPGPVLAASGKPGAAESKASPGGGGVPGAFTIQNVSTTTRSVVEGGKLVTESIVELQGIALGAGAVTIDSIRSVAHAISDGNKATNDGSTVVSGFKVAGQPAAVGENGVEGLSGPAKAVYDASKIDIRVSKGSGSAEGGSADRVSNGVQVELPNPAASANPQFVGSRFVLSLAPTAVGALASPPFDSTFIDQLPLDTTTTGVAAGGGFGSVAGTFGEVFAAPAERAIVGGANGARTVALGSPLDAERASDTLGGSGTVPVGLVLASGAFMLFAGRWVRRYAAQFLSSQE